LEYEAKYFESFVNFCLTYLKRNEIDENEAKHVKFNIIVGRKIKKIVVLTMRKKENKL
jgi:hypothetical protein